MLLIVYTTTLRRFVIFTYRYFKLSWNTTALSQSNYRNFSCSSIKQEIKHGKLCSQNRAHDHALSDDTRLNLREKLSPVLKYYKNQSEHIRVQMRLIVRIYWIYSENVSPREADWSVVNVSHVASFTSARNKGGVRGGTNTAIPHMVAWEYRNTTSKFSKIPKPQLQIGKSRCGNITNPPFK